MTISTITTILIKSSSTPNAQPTPDQLQLGELAVNSFDGYLFTKRYRAGYGTDVVQIGYNQFPVVTNLIYVTSDGNDSNSGRTLGLAKRTIRGAVAIASPGSVIKVSAGNYLENNPITLPDYVGVVGDSLREVFVTPLNQGDLFYVGSGNYFYNMSFSGSANPGAVVSFDPNAVRYIQHSPYVQNCTNLIPNSIGMKIDGNNAIGPLKSMVLDAYTQYNQGGIGVSITNEGYAQLVSLFTICDDVAVYCGSGAACDLTNSNSSFGNYGLVADGIGAKKYTGIVTQAAPANSSVFTLNVSTPTLSISTAYYNNTTGILTAYTTTPHGFSVGMGISLSNLQFTCAGVGGTAYYPDGNYGYVFEAKTVSNTGFTVNVGPSTTQNQVYVSGGTANINVSRPFDGQVVYLDNLYSSVNSISVGSGGTGYTNTPTVTIDPPPTSWGIQAQGIANISNGTVTSIDIVSGGLGYVYPPNVTISAPNIGINTATASLQMVPTYYSVVSSTPVSGGICTVTLNNNVPYAVGVGTTVPFFKQSRVLASGHSFEYIGTGVTITNSLPAAGGVPIQANETNSRNGGLVIYTSTNQSGNFRIGDGVVINQQAGTISGTAYSKSLFSTMTPFILALGGS